LHGGSVTAASEVIGKGSQFVVTLPLVRPPIQNERNLTKPASSEGQRVLVVDDNADAAKLLTLLISHLGLHEIEIAHDGPVAIEKAIQFKTDIILLDIGLPEMDGYAVAAKLREMDELSDILIVALTGYGQEEDRHKSRAAGCDVHLVKPVEVETIQQLLCHPKLLRS
jgi:CheY-like chemotaxis protein